MTGGSTLIGESTSISESDKALIRLARPFLIVLAFLSGLLLAGDEGFWSVVVPG